eukprot:m.564923 g.564923  ORF g.564923 m.564923 type:complete len:108 (+) comp57821_c1_seq17:717-1040(+)
MPARFNISSLPSGRFTEFLFGREKSVEVTVEGGCGLVLSEQLDSLAEEGKELIVEDPISEDAPSVVLEACCDDIGGEQPSESEPLPPTPALALMNLALTEEDFELPP